MPQVHDHQVHHPPLCPRFLSHMKARPEDFHPYCDLNNKYQQQLPSQGKMQSFNLPLATETQFLEGKVIKPSVAFTLPEQQMQRASHSPLISFPFVLV